MKKRFPGGITGANLRASGIKRDLRKLTPHLGYENYEFDVPVGEHGDCYDRFTVRIEEMRQSLRIIRQVIETMPDGPINMVDTKGTLPERKKVLTDMESLIRQFMTTTMGVNAPAGQVYFAAETRRESWVSSWTPRGAGFPTACACAPPPSATCPSCRN